MKTKTPVLLPSAHKIMEEFGANLKLARQRRRLSAEMVAERAGISRTSLWLAEKGAPTVAMGAYIQILFVLGLEKDLLQVGNDDVLGRKLQDLRLPTRQRASKSKTK